MAQINSYFHLVWDKLEAWVRQFILMLPNIFIAIIVLFLTFVVAKFLRRTSDKLLIRFTHSSSLNNLVSTTIYSVVILLGLFFTLTILKLDKTVTTLLAGAGIIGLALGFAFQDIAANFISGVIIAIRKPFVVGDVIDTNDHFGTIERINLRTVDLRRQTGELVKVPNRKVFESAIINYSHYGVRRIDLKVGVSYSADLEQVQQIVREAMKGITKMVETKEVEVVFTEFNDSSIDFLVRFWIQYKRQFDYINARSEAIIKIKKAFDQNNITIPFPIRALDISQQGVQEVLVQLKEQLGLDNAPKQTDEANSSVEGDHEKGSEA